MVRRIVAGELARTQQGAAFFRFLERADQRLDGVRGDAARPQQPCRLTAQVDHGGFQPDGAGAVIQDEADAPVEFFGDMGSGGRADIARTIGAGGCDGLAKQGQQAARALWRWHAHGQGIQPGAAQQRDAAAVQAGEHESQGPRPEGGGQAARALIEMDLAGGGGGTWEMADQGIEGRPLLDLEDARNRGVVGGVAAEAIDRLGGEGDERAMGEQVGRLGQGLVVDGQDAGLESLHGCDDRQRRGVRKACLGCLDRQSGAAIDRRQRSRATAAPFSASEGSRVTPAPEAGPGPSPHRLCGGSFVIGSADHVS